MKVLSPLLISLIIVFVATTQPSSAIAPEHGPSASGNGAFSFFNGLRTESFSFSFDARANKNDHATGQAEFDNLTTQTQVVVKINCLDVSGGIAVMTGRVQHSDDPDFPKSTNVIFAATDFELFPFFGGDTITPLFVTPTPDFDCHDGEPLTILPAGGEIEILP
jgi:hypothetical protein